MRLARPSLPPRARRSVAPNLRREPGAQVRVEWCRRASVRQRTWVRRAWGSSPGQPRLVQPAKEGQRGTLGPSRVPQRLQPLVKREGRAPGARPPLAWETGAGRWGKVSRPERPADVSPHGFPRRARGEGELPWGLVRSGPARPAHRCGSGLSARWARDLRGATRTEASSRRTGLSRCQEAPCHPWGSRRNTRPLRGAE